MPAETTIQFRQGTASQWSTANPTLAVGEVGFVTSGTDTWGKPNTFKIGDGTSNWKTLGYPNQGVGSTLQLATAITVNGVTNVDWSQPSYTFPAEAGTLTGTTLKSTVVSSSLTKVGALSSGTAGFVKVDASGNLTSDGSTYLSTSTTTLPSGVVNSSITKLGTLNTPSSTVNFVMIDPATNSLYKNPSTYITTGSTVTIGSTAVTVGGSATSFAGLNSLSFANVGASGVTGIYMVGAATRTAPYIRIVDNATPTPNEIFKVESDGRTDINGQFNSYNTGVLTSPTIDGDADFQGSLSYLGMSTLSGNKTITNLPGTTAGAATPSMYISVYQPGANTTTGFVGAEYRVSSNTSNAAYLMTFSSTGGVKGSISLASTGVTYGTSSDYRLKENIELLTGAIARLKELKPSTFNFIGSESDHEGFIAHELQEVVPIAVTGTKDGVDDNGNPDYQGVDLGKVVPLLTAALQEAVAKIEALETRIAALEGN